MRGCSERRASAGSMLLSSVCVKPVWRTVLQRGAGAASLSSVGGVRVRSISHWNESEITTDRKSRFQARHAPLQSAAEIPGILKSFLAAHKSAGKASHPHIIAWRTADEAGGRPVNVQQGYHDNGEKGAGIKILDQVLVRHGVYNVLVIVTRWYGGSPLGGSRFRHIVNVSSESLRKGGLLG